MKSSSRSATPSTSSPLRLTLVESLARAVAQRERLSLHELPRCRREVRLQLAVSRLVPLRGESKFPLMRDLTPAGVEQHRFR